MKPYSVRHLDACDSDDWLEMWNDYLTFYNTSLISEVSEHTLKSLLSEEDAIGSLIAHDTQNKSLGFLNFVIHPSTWSLRPECYLQDLFVKPQYRQEGVAKLLLEQLKKISDAKQCSQVYWMTKPDNHIAQAFYNKIATSEPWLVYVMK